MVWHVPRCWLLVWRSAERGGTSSQLRTNRPVAQPGHQHSWSPLSYSPSLSRCRHCDSQAVLVACFLLGSVVAADLLYGSAPPPPSAALPLALLVRVLPAVSAPRGSPAVLVVRPLPRCLGSRGLSLQSLARSALPCLRVGTRRPGASPRQGCCCPPWLPQAARPYGHRGPWRGHPPPNQLVRLLLTTGWVGFLTPLGCPPRQWSSTRKGSRSPSWWHSCRTFSGAGSSPSGSSAPCCKATTSAASDFRQQVLFFQKGFSLLQEGYHRQQPAFCEPRSVPLRPWASSICRPPWSPRCRCSSSRPTST